MDDELIETDELSLHRRSLLPGKGFFYPDSLDEDRTEERIEEAVDGAEAVIITDSDADGLGCAALVREVYDATLDVGPFEKRLAEKLGSGDETDEDDDDEERSLLEDVHTKSTVALVASGPHNLEESLEYVAKHAESGAYFYICDICPDSYDAIGDSLETLVELGDAVSWFDHHQWDAEVAEAIRAAGVTLVVGESEEECTVDVALRSLDYEFDEQYQELAEVTRDHDLWLKEDERSDDLADYAYWSGPEEYATIVGTYGAALPQTVLDYVAHRRVEKEQRIEAAVERASVHEIGEWTVGVTYGRCSQNEVADALREQGCDAAVIVKPSGSASIRGSDGFQRAHEVAGQVNGGGHPKAAGCKPDIYDDMLDMAQHWTTEGQATRKVILGAFENLVAE
ncbi:DHH family phosphoesterase [Halolamina sp.]|jgi:oligoribonuclease NrnB/cAMP/cGMP phosphodiesterase (DHH superfamily)|uniref:DHH family phosphoesterase n=1 Tax=Halolamina sp. TaxID=1940283 RepID=UPI003564D6DB